MFFGRKFVIPLLALAIAATFGAANSLLVPIAVPMLLAIAGIAWFVYRYYAGR